MAIWAFFLLDIFLAGKLFCRKILIIVVSANLGCERWGEEVGGVEGCPGMGVRRHVGHQPVVRGAVGRGFRAAGVPEAQPLLRVSRSRVLLVPKAGPKAVHFLCCIVRIVEDKRLCPKIEAIFTREF